MKVKNFIASGGFEDLKLTTVNSFIYFSLIFNSTKKMLYFSYLQSTCFLSDFENNNAIL